MISIDIIAVYKNLEIQITFYDIAIWQSEN